MRRIVPALVVAALIGTGIAAPGLASDALGGTPPLSPIRLTAEALAGRPAPVEAFLEDQLTTAAPDDQLNVLVHADEIATAEAALAAVSAPHVTSFERIGVAVGAATPDQIRRLRTTSGVVYLEGNRPVDYFLDTSHHATRGADARTAFQPEAEAAPLPPQCKAKGKGKGTGLDQHCPEPAPSFAEEIDGSGVSIAVVDSGIDGTHPFFQLPDGSSKVVRNLRVVVAGCPVWFTDDRGIPCSGDNTVLASTVEDVPGNNSDQPGTGGHGTHVAGIAAGLDVTVPELDSTLHGAAPDARLIGLATGAGALIGTLEGLEWVLENHAQPCGADADPASCPPIRVVNNSYGSVGVGDEYDPNSAVAKMQDLIVGEGVVMVWAAGNGDTLNDGGDGSDVRVNAPAQSPTPGIIAVANYDDQNKGARDGALSSSSSRGQSGQLATYPDISAPGTRITSACRITLDCGTSSANPDYGTISGTSMAAPHIAGIVAQLLEVDPSLSPADVEDILEDTTYKFTFGAAYEPDLAARNADGTTSFDKGHGLVDVKAAVAQMLGITIEDTPPPSCVSGPVAIDEAGDNENGVTGGQHPSTDVLWASVEAGAAPESLLVTIKVTDLLEEYPDGTTGTFWDLNFNIGATDVFVAAGRDLIDPPDTDAERFLIGRSRSTLETLTEGVAGSFDYESDVITMTLTQADFDAANADIEARNAEPGATVEGTLPPISDGLVLSDFVLTARESTYVGAGSLLVTVDTGAGICSYQHGTGVVPSSTKASGDTPPPETTDPPDPSEYDDELSSANATVAWSGTAVVPAYPTATVGGCLGPADPLCTNFRLYVSEPGALTVTVTFPESDDWDIYLYGPGGGVVTDSATDDHPEVMTFTVTTPGVYTVAALPFLTPAGTFDALAALAPPA